MQVWRDGQPTFMLPWHPRILRCVFVLVFSLGLITAYELWVSGVSTLTCWMSVAFSVFSGLVLVIVKLGYAQLTGDTLSYWQYGFRQVRLQHNDTLSQLRKGFGHPAYHSVFKERVRDLQTRLDEMCSLPSSTPEYVFDFGVMRAWKVSDGRAYKDLFGDPEIIRWHAMTQPTLDESLARVIFAAEVRPYRTQWHYAIATEEAGVIGHFELRLISARLGSVEVSFGLCTSHRRLGIMTKCLSHIISTWPESFGVHTFYARVRPENAPCQDLLKRCGFTRCQQPNASLISYGALSDVQLFQRIVPC